MALKLLDFFGMHRADWVLSKQVCTGCPVKRECLTYGLATRSVHGVWGGLDPLELRFTLGRDAGGNVWTYSKTDVKCPACRGATESIELSDVAVTRKCVDCGFDWVRAERKRARRKRAIKLQPKVDAA